MALAFLQSAVSTANASEYTFAAQALGAAAADRYVAVGAVGRGTVGGGVASGTVNGVAVAIDVQTTNTTVFFTTAAMVKANVTTDTTGDVVITFSNSMLRAGIGMWRMDSLNSATPTDTESSTADAPTANVSVNSGGYILACAYSSDSAGGPQTTWTNLTERYDEDVEGATGSTQSGADTTSASTQVLTCTATFATPLTCAGVFVSYDVAGAPPAAARHFLLMGA